LVTASNYSVKIKPEFTSMDGLAIKGFNHSFITRKLRYNQIHSKKTIYNQPISIRFNMPVDLDKTMKEIWVKNTDTNKRIDFTLEYGTKKEFNGKKDEYEEVEDKSTLLVYNKKDKHGRKKFWDFKTNYFLMIERAYPLRGDIVLSESREANIQVTGIVEDITAESERTKFSTKDFFDPQGKLWVKFYEDIDLKKSGIKSKYLIKTGYGEKCKNSNENFSMSRTLECEKEEDKSRIYFIFDHSKINLGETLELNLNKIKNTQGEQINGKKIIKEIKVIPKLKILKSIPANKSENASLTNFYICSNSPIARASKDDAQNYIGFNLPYEFKSWRAPMLAPKDKRNNSYYKCNSGEFQTAIYYGLIPEADYELNFNATDNFGSGDSISINFRTQKMPDKLLNFFHFQDKFIVTAPDRTKLTYAVENMEYVNMRICRVDADDMLSILNKKPHYTSGPPATNKCVEISEHKINLEKKYFIKNYFQVDLKDYIENPFGYYILTFYHPDYKEHYSKNRPVYERTYINITNLSVVEKKIDVNKIETREGKEKIENLYWVVDAKTLDPVPNAKIDIYNKESREGAIYKLPSARTNASGIAKSSAGDHIAGIIVSTDNDSAIVADAHSNIKSAGKANSMKKIYTYTDRPIYKPGQTAHIKGLYRIGFDGDYEIFNDKKIALKIFNSRNEKIYYEQMPLNEYGTFNTDFELKEDAPLGKYRINTDYGNSYFEVEEYVPAPFKIEAKTDKDEYISGDTFNLDIDAGYYFGAPVEGGEIEYSIGSQNYHFDKYQDEYFRFGSNWYQCYWNCNYNDAFILRNKTSLSKDGKAAISHQLDFNKLFKNEEDRKSKIFVVYLTVKNPNGQSVSAQKSFIVHNGEFYLGLKTDRSFLGKNDPLNIKVKSVDTKGGETGVRNINLSINKKEWIRNKRKEVDGAYYYKWEEKLTPVTSKKINTDKNGNWNDSFRLKNEGEYKIEINAVDSIGNKISSSYNVYIYGESQVSIKPNNDTSLEIVSAKKDLNVGDTGEIIIKSPYKKAKALIAIERGKIFEYEIVDINQSLFNYKIPIKKEYIPNIYASVTLLSPDPEIKHGNLQFMINSEQQELNIEVKADKKYYLPGEEVTLNIKTKKYDNTPLRSEVSIAVADLSVLALKGNPKKNPLVFFYSGFPLTVTTASNIKNKLIEVNVPSGTKGGGGAEPEDLAKKKRGVFKDTAFWQAVVETDEQGRAEVKFTLPDNLTTWQIESLGITKDTELGIDYREFIARKKLMVIPLKPRFIVPGDEFSIGAKIFNQSGYEQELKVELSDSTLEIVGRKTKKIKLQNEESTVVYFEVKAQNNIENGAHKFTLLAENEELKDEVEKTISITPNDTYEVTATGGYSKNAVVSEYAFVPEKVLRDKGELEIKTSATMAVFLTDALNYMLSYPYGCSEQIASKLSAIAIIKSGLNLENIGDKFELKKVEYNEKEYTIDELVEVGLSELYKNQKNNGGFSYYPAISRTSYHLSLQVAQTLGDLKNAGYKVDDAALRNLFNYINAIKRQRPEIYNDNNDIILAAHTLMQLNGYGKIDKYIIDRIKGFEKDEKFINEEISNLSLVDLAIVLTENSKTYNKNYKNKIYDILENRIEIDSRGAFLRPNNNVIWQYYETPIKNTSLLLEALIKDKRDNAILDRITRWLLRSRSKDGSWGSTNNTLAAINSLTEYIIWQEENKSNFNLKILLNNEEKSSFDYNPRTILNQNNLTVPIYDLGVNKLNAVSFRKANNNKLNNNFYYDMS
ncbi:MAG: hypothetical protein GWO79_00135, partial [Actinobacteria bacterium]|nr:hypothetical protein [Actinomycetota bacterium]